MPNPTILPLKDTYIDYYQPNTNYGSGSDVQYGVLYIAGVKSFCCRALLQTTIPPEIQAAEVMAAYLVLYSTPTGAGGVGAKVCRVTQAAWTEAGATWNKYDGASAWGTLGGDYDNVTDYAAFTTPTAVGWQWIDVTALVTHIITSHSGNFDVLIRIDTESAGVNQLEAFGGKDAASTWASAMLVIVRPPFGMPMEV